MPALALIPPDLLLKVLQADGFQVVHQDDYHWYLAKGLADVPIHLPKQPGEDGMVSMLVMEPLLFEAHIDHAKYFALLQLVAGGGGKPN